MRWSSGTGGSRRQVALRRPFRGRRLALLARAAVHQLHQHLVLVRELRDLLALLRDLPFASGDQRAVREHQRVQRLHFLWQFKRAFHRVLV